MWMMQSNRLLYVEAYKWTVKLIYKNSPCSLGRKVALPGEFTSPVMVFYDVYNFPRRLIAKECFAIRSYCGWSQAHLCSSISTYSKQTSTVFVNQFHLQYGSLWQPVVVSSHTFSTNYWQFVRMFFCITLVHNFEAKVQPLLRLISWCAVVLLHIVYSTDLA